MYEGWMLNLEVSCCRYWAVHSYFDHSLRTFVWVNVYRNKVKFDPHLHVGWMLDLAIFMFANWA